MSLVRVCSRFLFFCTYLVFALSLVACGGGGGGSGSGGSTTVTLNALSLSALSGTLKVGQTQQLNVTGRFSNGSTIDMSSAVNWSVENNSIVSVSNAGLVTALAAGSTVISVSYGENSALTAQRSVTVKALSSLTITPDDFTLKVGETQNLSVLGTYTDASTEDLTAQVSWLVEQGSFLSINSSSLLAATNPGTTKVTASFESVSGDIDVTVKALAAISIAPNSVTLAIGSEQSLSVTGLYTDNSTEPLDGLVSWASSAEGIASVSTSGLVTALSAGDAQISASLGAISGSMNVTVSPATLESLLLSAPVSQVAAGLATQIRATGIYSDGTEQDLSAQVVWSVNDTDKASIQTDSGLLTGVSQGNVTITATKTIGENTQTGSLAFTVSAATLSEIVVTPPVLSLAKGTSAEVNVTAIFSDKSKQDVTTQVLWSSSDESVASISESTNTLNALDEGANTLTASLADLSESMSVTVTSAVLTSITLDPITSSIPLGRTQQFVAQGTYSDGSVQDVTELVTWLSSSQDVALINNNLASKGLAESQALGVTTISAVSGDVQAQTSLNVVDAALESLEVLPEEQSVSNGTDASIAVYGHYSDGSILELTENVVWSVSDTSILDLGGISQGIVHTKAVGSALLSAEFEGQASLASINVTAATLQSINVTASQNALPSGMSLQFQATGTYSDSSTKDISQQVTWQTNDVSIASISNLASEAGTLRALSPGLASITASLGGLSAQQEVTVTSAVLRSLAVSAPATQLNVQSTMVLSALGTYTDDSVQDLSDQVNWKSAEVNTASISNTAGAKGQLRGLSAGSTTITATLNGVTSNSLLVDIVLNPNLPKALTLSVQPNVILNNNSDNSLITMTLVPSAAGGVISDGTPVSLSIKEGSDTRVENLTTTNGAVSFNLQSSYSGFIGLTATTGSLSSKSGLLSTNDFGNAIIARGQSDVVYEDNQLKAGSRFFIFLRNLSNRTFTIEKIDIGYFDPNNSNAPTGFIDSPLTEPGQLSGGSLTAGEFTYVGYQLDTDVDASEYFILYSMSDDTSGVSFPYGGTFNFAP